MKRLRKFLILTARERQLLIKAFVLLGVIRLGLWLLPFPVLRRLLATINQANPQPSHAPNTEQIVEAVNRSSRIMTGDAKCLARALTTQALMLRCGHSSEFRIGVAKGEKGQFEAHAWVESQGRIVIGNLTDLSRYTPMPSLAGGRL